MYSYTYDEETGGIILNSSPVYLSKEPRPVYSREMDLLGFSEYWSYEHLDNNPYMWAESGSYIYRGKLIAKITGGDIYHKPELTPVRDENGTVLYGKEVGYSLDPIDLKRMCDKNFDFIVFLENNSVKRIIKTYEKYNNKLDIFHVAFSGGKDSVVLLELVKKALPVGSYVVIFGDTGMEFPDTYDIVRDVKAICDRDKIPFYISSSHFNPKDSWKLFGPPARVLRWCCSVHKSTPQTLMLRKITGKNDYVGLDFVGVRSFESYTRSTYSYESYGKKQKGQYSFNPILEWTSAEIWLYIYSYNLPINKAYKNGNSRIGCLFCPMGGGKNDYFQYCFYHDEMDEYINIVKSLNARNEGDDAALCSYISNGGWNARKNGRDLKNNDEHYRDEIIGDKLIITVTSPRTNWQEWIKTVGPLPFSYTPTKMDNGYRIMLDASVATDYPKYLKKFKQVFKKAAYCLNCRVCETNCRNGCISFINGDVTISNCLHCGQCHDIDDGCLAYHSLWIAKGSGNMKSKSINSFGNHPPKVGWIKEFFILGNDFWENNSLGPMEVNIFKRFLRDSGLIDSKNVTTRLFEILSKLGWDNNSTWGIIISNLSYNPQCRWYVENMDVDVYYSRDQLSDMLVLNGMSKADAGSIIAAFRKLCELPMGYEENWGYVVENSRQIVGLSRTKCSILDNKVILYALYLFVEKCSLGNDVQIHLSYLFDNTAERAGISPVRMFGLNDEDHWRSILLGLSALYPDYIHASFTNDLKSISFCGKTSSDVLELFVRG